MKNQNSWHFCNFWGYDLKCTPVDRGQNIFSAKFNCKFKFSLPEESNKNHDLLSKTFESFYNAVEEKEQ